jgi:transposase-like protein
MKGGSQGQVVEVPSTFIKIHEGIYRTIIVFRRSVVFYVQSFYCSFGIFLRSVCRRSVILRLVVRRSTVRRSVFRRSAVPRSVFLRIAFQRLEGALNYELRMLLKIFV